MRNLFDDFLDELRRREAASRGEDPGPGRPSSEDGPGSDGDPDADDADGELDDRPRATGVDADDERDPGEEPRPIFEPSRRGEPTRRGGPPRRRGPGGPNDGGRFGGRAARAGRRFGLGVAIVVALGLVVLFGVGLDLWTDALWYASVGFDSVFWTRLTATVGLFAGGFILAAVVLLGNLWLARRLAPPAGTGGPSSLRGLFDRLNEAAQAADGRGARPGSGFGERRGAFGTGPGTVVFDAGDLPDLTPLAGIAITAVAIFAALIVGGSV